MLSNTTWTAKVMSLMWNYLLLMRRDQNEGVHGTSKTKSDLETEIAMMNLEKAYDSVRQTPDEWD